MRVKNSTCTTSIISSKQIKFDNFSYLYACTCMIKNTRKTLTSEKKDSQRNFLLCPYLSVLSFVKKSKQNIIMIFLSL